MELNQFRKENSKTQMIYLEGGLSMTKVAWWVGNSAIILLIKSTYTWQTLKKKMNYVAKTQICAVYLK